MHYGSVEVYLRLQTLYRRWLRGVRPSADHFDGEGDALASADTQGDDPASKSIPAHRMNEAGHEHCAGGTDRMPMCNGTTFHIDNILRQPEFARYDDGDGGESLVDFNALDIAQFPCRTFERLPEGGDIGPRPNMLGSTAAMP